MGLDVVGRDLGTQGLCMSLDPPLKWRGLAWRRPRMPCCVRRMRLARVTFTVNRRGTRGRRVSHSAIGVSAVFDDPNLVSCAGLASVVGLAQQCGLRELVATRLTCRPRAARTRM